MAGSGAVLVSKARSGSSQLSQPSLGFAGFASSHLSFGAESGHLGIRSPSYPDRGRNTRGPTSRCPGIAARSASQAGAPASRGSGGELILLLINLGKPNSPSRSQAGFTDIWKLLAYFQSPPMPLAVGTLSSGCRSGPEERPSPQERGQGPEHSGNVTLGGQRVS